MNVNIKNVRAIRDYVCKGCKTYIVSDDDKITLCHAPHKKNGHKCPCSTCLIKGMCTTNCDEFILHSGSNRTHDPKDPSIRIIDYQYKAEWGMKSKGTRFGFASTGDTHYEK